LHGRAAGAAGRGAPPSGFSRSSRASPGADRPARAEGHAQPSVKNCALVDAHGIGFITVRKTEKFRKILCKLDEPSAVLLTLTRKTARMSHQFIERKDYIKELECKLKEATLRLQLQQKLSELELFFRKVQEQLKLRNSDLWAVIDEIARIDKARTLGALSQGRLKQTVLPPINCLVNFV
jgi:hypothetical protein